MNLHEMTLPQLRKLMEDVNVEIKSRSKAEIDRARAEVAEIAKRVGMSVEELVSGMSAPKAKKTAPVKFRHPEDSSLQWTGRGREPKWIKEWKEAGRPLEELAPA